MNKNIYIGNNFLLILLTMVLLNVGCTKNFEKWNTDQYQATEEMLQYDNLATGSFFVQMEKNVFPIAQQPAFGDEVYQTMQNLAGDIFSGFMGASNNWFSGANNSTYSLVPDWYGQAFDRGFIGIMPPWLSIKKAAGEEMPQVLAMATIVKVLAMQRITDMYGPLPYLNFGGGDLQNTYDSQEEIYNSFFNELDEAINILTDFNDRNPESKIMETYDFIFNGDVTKWILFANSIRLRLAIRVSYAVPQRAQQEAEAAVNHSLGVLKNSSEVALLRQGEDLSYNNPLYIICYNFDDTRMGANMESFLKGYEDPRISAFFNLGSDGEYHGIRNGINIANKSSYSEGVFSTLNINSSTPIIWMHPAEVYFLRAEGALRGWDMGGDAKSLYEEGVRTSFDYWGASGVENYLQDESSTASSYSDPVNGGNNVNSSSDLLSTITIKWDNNAGFERNLERIITQKWISLYPDGQEAWSEFRRTGYPRVFPVVVNNSGGSISTSNQIRRLPFPTAEYQNNAMGVSQGVSLLGGNDNGGTKLWWDKK